MFGKLRALGRGIQAKYEGLIANKNLYGFSDLYAKAMSQIKERERKGAD